MPDGKTHAILTVATSFGLFSVSNYFQFPLEISLSLMSGGFVGLILTPDLDQAESRKSIWHLYWWIYGKVIKHRDVWSHFPMLSTIIRLIYLFGLPLFILWWYYPIENWKYWDLVGYGILGLMASDTIHFFADIVTTKIKRTF